MVISNLELLRKRLIDDPGAISLLDNAMEGAKRGAVLTQHMLAFARRQEIDVRPTDVADVVYGMRKLLARALDPSIGLMVDLPLHLPKVAVDPTQLEAILLNLAINARDAMPEGGNIKFTAKIERFEGNEYVRLSVIDEGTGMDEETISRATEPFFYNEGPRQGHRARSVHDARARTAMGRGHVDHQQTRQGHIGEAQAPAGHRA